MNKYRVVDIDSKQVYAVHVVLSFAIETNATNVEYGLPLQVDNTANFHMSPQLVS